MGKNNLIFTFPWYVLFFAIYPPLALLAHNIGEVEYDAARRAMLLSAAAAFVLVWLIYLLTHDWKKSGALVVLAVIGFFFYGHVFGYLRGFEINGFVLGRHTYFIVFWIGLFAFLAWKLFSGAWRTSGLPPVLTAMGLLLVLIPLYQLVSYRVRVWQNSQVIVPSISLPAQTEKTPPDIYFIILDMYGRHDVLLDEFDYDDSAFLQELEDLGFYVASCSQSNYHSTAYSLSATLNASYLDDLNDSFNSENASVTLIWHLIRENAVAAALRGQGYRIVAFETDYDWTELEDADYFYRLPSTGINDFEDLLLSNSFLSVFAEKGLLDRFRLTASQRKHDLSVYVLDELERVPSLPGPKFVFVHLTIPHPPFVIGPDGELLVVAPHYKNNELYYVRDEYEVGYQNQLAYLNRRVPQVLKAILATSAQPPVIILQGDHGPRFVEIDKQLDILNAYYFPAPRPQVSPWMTPVNNFRIIFNTYFGASLPLLPDHSYVSDTSQPYDFQEVPNPCAPQ